MLIKVKASKHRFYKSLILFIFSLMIFTSGCSQQQGSNQSSLSPSTIPTTTPAATPEPTPVPTATLVPTTTPVPTATTAPTPIPTQIKTNKSVPILYYHAVNDTTWGIAELFVKPAEFEKQMDFLKNNGYTVITFNDLTNVASIEKPIIITLDDGYEDNYTHAYPILKKYNFRATVFMVGEYIDKSAFLKKDQILKMTDLINFQSHTITHPYLTKLTDAEIESELEQSKKQLEGLTGMPVNVLAYPIGDYNQRVINITKKYYNYAVLNGGGMYKTGDNNFQMKRIYIERNLSISGFEAKLKAAY